MKIITVKILPTGWEDTSQLIRFENNVNRYWFLEYSDTQKEWYFNLAEIINDQPLHSKKVKKQTFYLLESCPFS